MATWNINITVDGTTVWSMGPFDTEEQASAFMDLKDEYLGDLVTDFTNEAREEALTAGGGNYWPNVDVALGCVNSPGIWQSEEAVEHERDILDFISEMPNAVSYWALVESQIHRLDIVCVDEPTQQIVVTPGSLAGWLRHDAARVVAGARVNSGIASTILMLAAGRWDDAEWDVETCDVVVQLMLFGKIVYG